MTAVAPPYALDDTEARWGMEQAGLQLQILARAEDTDGNFTFMRYTAPPGFTGPPLHRHADLDEAMLVMEGRMGVRVGDDEHVLGAGEFIWMPRQVPHGFLNIGDTAMRFLGIVSPPGRMEEFFAAAQEEFAGEGEPDPERLMELNARHGIEVLGPPLSADDLSVDA